MSRRNKADRLFIRLHVHCSEDRRHNLGDIFKIDDRLPGVVDGHGHYAVNAPLVRIPTPDGSWKVRGACMEPSCRLYGKPRERVGTFFVEALAALEEEGRRAGHVAM